MIPNSLVQVIDENRWVTESLKRSTYNDESMAPTYAAPIVVPREGTTTAEFMIIVGRREDVKNRSVITDPVKSP